MKYLSLFSGIGGFEYGLAQSIHTFENIGYSEIDKYAVSIYEKHYPNHINLGDATEIDPTEIEDFELLVAGFPCQAFSLSGKRQGFNDCRGTLFFEIARICEEKGPKYLLFENVKGLISHDGGRTFKKILGVLSELGYDVEWQVYNSKSFGTAQNRERLYIKGYFRAKCGGEILSQKRDCGETDLQIISHHFQRQVRKRVNEADYNELSSFLRKYKKSSGLSVKAIAALLNRPVSEVEHWFRTDNFFAPPTDDVWLQLKQILGITDDKYDAFLTEFEWVDGVYDMDKRADDINGLSSTLTTRNESLIVDPSVEVIGTTSPTGHWGKRVYADDGLSPTLCSQSLHKNGVRVMLDDDPKNTLSATDEKHPLKVKTNTSKGYDEVTAGDGVRLCHPTSTKARGRTQKGQTGALSTSADWGTVERDYRIRKLTPKECERLQAFPDDYTKYGKDGELISDTQRYKCLGNAVTTTVVTYIANTMFGDNVR